MLSLSRIKKLQDQVDQLDSMIAGLVLERFALDHEILLIREANGLGLVDSTWEQSKIEKVGAVNETAEKQLALMRVFRAIMDWSLKCYPRKDVVNQDEFLH